MTKQILNNPVWNYINFFLSLLILLLLNRVIGFNQLRGEIEIILNLGRQIILFTGFNIITGNIIYFYNDRQAFIYQRIYGLTFYILPLLTILCFIILFKFLEFEYLIAIISITTILAMDFLSFTHVARGEVYTQYFLQSIFKLINILTIIALEILGGRLELFLITYLFMYIFLYKISFKLNFGPQLSFEIRPIWAELKKILKFSIPWIIASPLINYLATIVWLRLPNNSNEIAYYSLILFGTSMISILLINPKIDKLTHELRSGIRESKIITKLILLSIIIGTLGYLDFGLFKKIPIVNYLTMELLALDAPFLDNYLFLILSYAALNIPLSIVNRLLLIYQKPILQAVIAVFAGAIQIVLIYSFDIDGLTSFIHISVIGTFIIFVITYVYLIINHNWKILTWLYLPFLLYLLSAL